MKYLFSFISIFLLSCNSVSDQIDKISDKIRDEKTPTYTPTSLPTKTATIKPTFEPTPATVVKPTIRPTKIPTANPTIIPTQQIPTQQNPTHQPTAVTTTNPIAPGIENFIDGNYGNLWKPVSDTTGNLVVVFNNKYKKKFSEGCFVEKKNGELEEMFCDDVFKCFGNPDRLTLRSNIKCNEVKEVKVVCYEANQSVTFTVDKEKKGQVCRRHD